MNQRPAFCFSISIILLSPDTNGYEELGMFRYIMMLINKSDIHKRLIFIPYFRMIQ